MATPADLGSGPGRGREGRRRTRDEDERRALGTAVGIALLSDPYAGRRGVGSIDRGVLADRLWRQGVHPGRWVNEATRRELLERAVGIALMSEFPADEDGGLDTGVLADRLWKQGVRPGRFAGRALTGDRLLAPYALVMGVTMLVLFLIAALALLAVAIESDTSVMGAAAAGTAVQSSDLPGAFADLPGQRSAPAPGLREVAA